ncbi:MAG: medium chain dehydrogenase/reductase family protein [Bacteroidota bacterium]
MIYTKAILCTDDQKIFVARLILPDLRPKDILIKNLYSGISNGTELMLIRKKVSWGSFPIWLGYQAVGIVEKIGSEVNEFKVGDKVYHRGCSVTATINGQHISSTSGAHGTYAIVDTTSHLYSAAILPDKIDMEAASLFVMASVGLNGVNLSGVKTGDIVVVQGAGLVGLGNVAAAKLRGATVIIIDIQPDRLKIALKLGADHTINATQENVSQRIAQLAPHGPDIVFESTGLAQFINIALSYCKIYGKFVFQGDYGQFGQLSFNFYLAHEKLLTAYFPSDDGFQPCRKTIMDWMAIGALKWEQTITHRLSVEDAPEFYNTIKSGETQNVLGAVIRWD